MKKLIKLVSGLLFMGSIGAFAQSPIDSAFNASSSGTTSATVVIPQGPGVANVTDLGWRLDANLTTGTIGIRSGVGAPIAVTSATAASGSVLWFTNTGTGITGGTYVIYYNAAAGTYSLFRGKSATTTSLTIQDTITTTTTTNDRLWACGSTTERPVPALNSSTTGPMLWLPKNVPSALTVDGNTTSCRISLSSVRSLAK